MTNMMSGMSASMLLYALLCVAVLAIVIGGTVWLLRLVMPAHNRQPLARASHQGIGAAFANATFDNSAAPDAFQAADFDRARAARLLHQHHAAGRLTLDELDQRVTAAHAARTIGQLRTLLSDLPHHIP